LAQRNWPPSIAFFIYATLGQNKTAILEFVALAVLVIAVIGAIGSYTQKYLTTSVAQWVAHDLRRSLYHHIPSGCRFPIHDNKRTGLDQPGHQRHRFGSGFYFAGVIGTGGQHLDAGGMLAVMFIWTGVLPFIALSVAPVLFIVVHTASRAH